MAVSFGLTQKLFLSAFESAWAPFYYATIREPDARRVFRVVTTYGVAVLALLTAGLSAVGRDVAQAMTHGFLLAPDDPRWRRSDRHHVDGGRRVLQGVYLLTSIGLNITKRTQYYPVATMAAAVTNVGLNFLLIPRFGHRRRGWANARGVRACRPSLGVRLLAAVLSVAYEWGRLARVALFSVLAYVAGRIASVDSTRARLLRSWLAPGARHPRSRHDGGRRVSSACWPSADSFRPRSLLRCAGSAACGEAGHQS